jgi:hypothetical protein
LRLSSPLLVLLALLALLALLVLLVLLELLELLELVLLVLLLVQHIVFNIGLLNDSVLLEQPLEFSNLPILVHQLPILVRQLLILQLVNFRSELVDGFLVALGFFTKNVNSCAERAFSKVHHLCGVFSLLRKALVRRSTFLFESGSCHSTIFIPAAPMCLFSVARLSILIIDKLPTPLIHLGHHQSAVLLLRIQSHLPLIESGHRGIWVL